MPSPKRKKKGEEAANRPARPAAGEAGKEAGKAAAHAGKATGEATKKAAKKTAQVTKRCGQGDRGGYGEGGEGRPKKAVTPDTTSAACNDGTVQTGKTKTTACADHGGVKN